MFDFGVCELNDEGPLHAYVAPAPASAAVKLIAAFTHTLFVPLICATGKGFTVTVCVAVFVQPFNVAVKVYAPLLFNAAEPMLADDVFEVNDEGPLHAYVAPTPASAAVKLIAAFSHTLFAPLICAIGNALTVTFVNAEEEQPFKLVIKI
jgi:hypothetical protein